MLKKWANIWWIFTIIAFIGAFLDPYIGIFAIMLILSLFFDFIIGVILKGHYNAFTKKINDCKQKHSIVINIFKKEVLLLQAVKIFITVGTLYLLIVVFFQNIETQKIVAPIYMITIQKSFFLQIICLLLAIVSTIFSCILFWFHANSFKDKLIERTWRE